MADASHRWRGERMDYELGVWVLCNQVARAKRAGAEAVNDEGVGQKTFLRKRPVVALHVKTDKMPELERETFTA